MKKEIKKTFTFSLTVNEYNKLIKLQEYTGLSKSQLVGIGIQVLLGKYRSCMDSSQWFEEYWKEASK